MKKTLSLIVCIFLCISSIKAQYYQDVSFGAKLGVGTSKISHTYESVYRPGYVNYTWKDKTKVGFFIGGFLNYRPGGSAKIALQPEVYYSMEPFENTYSDVQGLNYTMRFKYNYLQINTLVKYYPISGFNIGVGPQLGFALNRNNITYSSNKPDEYGGDALVENLLRNGFYGKNNFQAVFSLGYEFEKGLTLDLRYNLGLSDMIETKSNSYGWTEQKNMLSTFQFSIGYAFGVEN